MLRFMGLQRVGHDWMTELNWQSSIHYAISLIILIKECDMHFHLQCCLNQGKIVWLLLDSASLLKLIINSILFNIYLVLLLIYISATQRIPWFCVRALYFLGKANLIEVYDTTLLLFLLMKFQFYFFKESEMLLKRMY